MRSEFLSRPQQGESLPKRSRTSHHALSSLRTPSRRAHPFGHNVWITLLVTACPLSSTVCNRRSLGGCPSYHNTFEKPSLLFLVKPVKDKTVFRRNWLLKSPLRLSSSQKGIKSTTRAANESYPFKLGVCARRTYLAPCERLCSAHKEGSEIGTSSRSRTTACKTGQGRPSRSWPVREHSSTATQSAGETELVVEAGHVTCFHVPTLYSRSLSPPRVTKRTNGLSHRLAPLSNENCCVDGKCLHWSGLSHKLTQAALTRSGSFHTRICTCGVCVVVCPCTCTLRCWQPATTAPCVCCGLCCWCVCVGKRGRRMYYRVAFSCIVCSVYKMVPTRRNNATKLCITLKKNHNCAGGAGEAKCPLHLTLQRKLARQCHLDPAGVLLLLRELANSSGTIHSMSSRQTASCDRYLQPASGTSHLGGFTCILQTAHSSGRHLQWPLHLPLLLTTANSFLISAGTPLLMRFSASGASESGKCSMRCVQGVLVRR